MYNLQKRWALEGTVLRYYGLRNRPNMFKNTVKLTKTQKTIIEKLPCELTTEEISNLKNLIGVQVVKSEDLITIPSSENKYPLTIPSSFKLVIFSPVAISYKAKLII